MGNNKEQIISEIWSLVLFDSGKPIEMNQLLYKLNYE